MSAPLVPFALSLIAGIVIGYYHPVSEHVSLAVLILSFVVSIFLHRLPRLQTAALWLTTAIMGMHLVEQQYRTVHTLPQGHDYIVASAPVDKGKTIVMDALSSDGKKVRLRMMKGATLHVGNGLTISNNVQPITYYPLYFDSQGYCGGLFAGYHDWEGKAVSMKGLSVLQRIRLRLLNYREQLTQRYRDHGLTDDAYSVLAAMTLGDKSALTKELRDTYSQTGASHILALSGLHLGIIYWLITLMMVSRRWRTVTMTVTILAIWAFTFLTGLATSTVRSAIMLTVYSLLQIGYRERASVNVLAFTAITLLVVHPMAVFDVGFQLSFMAVLSILLFYPLLYSLLPLPILQEHRLLKWLWGLSCVSIAAQLGVAPLIAFHFHRFSTWFLLSNFIVVPGAYIIIVGAFALLLSGATWIATLLATVVTLMNQTLTQMTSWPLASIEGLYPSVIQTMLIYVAIGAFFISAKVMTKDQIY